MTKERYNEIIQKLGDKEEYDVDILSYELDKIDVSVEEAFIICAGWLGYECLLTFEYRSNCFYNEEQANLLNNVFELNHDLI